MGNCLVRDTGHFIDLGIEGFANREGPIARLLFSAVSAPIDNKRSGTR